jgi:hypothetical protein
MPKTTAMGGAETGFRSQESGVTLLDAWTN